MSASEVSTFWMQWYYATDGQRLGPVPHFELERLVRSGTIKSDSLLWRQGMNNWQTLDEIRAADPSLISISQPPPITEKNWEDAADVTDTNHESGDVAGSRAGNRFGQRANADGADTQDDFASGTFRRAREGRSDSESKQAEPMAFAGFMVRVGAFFVDSVILFLVFKLIAGLTATVYFPEAVRVVNDLPNRGFKYTPEDVMIVTPLYGLMFGLLLGLVFVYNTFFILKYSATPGKLLFGLQVVNAEGAPLGFGRIIGRSLAKALVCLTLGIGFVVVAVDEQKRGLHDFFCSTRVIKKRR